MTKRYIVLVILALVISPLRANTVSMSLTQANEAFTCNDQSVQPEPIRSFQNWLSDYRPPIVTPINVSAVFDNNPFSTDFLQQKMEKLPSIWKRAGLFNISIWTV